MEWNEILRYNNKLRDAVRKEHEISAQKLAVIKKHCQTKLIRYPEYAAAWDYVHKLYPYAAVKYAAVYYSPRAVVDAAGYSGVGGFFDFPSKTIVITDGLTQQEDIHAPFSVKAEIDLDEVLCHELIHYAANYKSRPANVHVEEWIAYGKSAGYLRSKGFTDDDIITKNMMPYLVSVVSRFGVIAKVLGENHKTISSIQNLDNDALTAALRPYERQIREEWMSQAYQMGLNILKSYATDDPSSDSNLPSPLFTAETRRRSFVLDDDM
jgi:hypothetical protein